MIEQIKIGALRMFGYIQPLISELKVKESVLYKAVYCGLCKTQRKRTGLLSSLTLSYDFVFLYLLRAEVTRTETTFKQRRVAFHRSSDPNYALENDQLRYCAATAALLNYYKVKDNIDDESFWKSFGARLILPYIQFSLKKAKKHTKLPEEDVKDAFEKLALLEKKGDCSPDELAEQSGRMLAAIASFGIEEELLRFACERFGMCVGKWLYLVDAADDYKDDIEKKRFNPFKTGGLQVQTLQCALDALCNDADLLFSKIPVYDPGYRAIITNTLFHGMNTTAQNALAKNEQSEKKGHTE